ELPSGKESKRLQVDPVANQGGAVSILPGGKTVAVAHLALGWNGGGANRFYYDIATGQEKARIGSTRGTGEGIYVGAVAVLPDETVAASNVHLKQGILFWDLRTGKQTRELDTKGMVGSLTFSPDGTLLAHTDSHGVEVVSYDHAASKV